MPGSLNPLCRKALRLCAAILLLPGPCLLAGRQTTQATTVPLLLPACLAFDSGGNLYIAEPGSHTILRVTPAGVLTTYAGNGTQGYAGDGGPALSAQMDSPTGLAISPAGDLYLSDPHTGTIRRIRAATGVISTIAGTGSAGSSQDGTPAATAPLNAPTALAFDLAGDLFFAESRGHRIRRIDASTGLLSTWAGTGRQGFSGDGGSALAASLDSPAGLAFDVAGDLYLADTHNNRIRRVDAVTHIISTVAGTGVPGFSGDTGPALAAALHLPGGFTVDPAGNLFFADSGNQRIRRIDAVTGIITTLAGQGTEAFAGDGAPAVAASLDSPGAVILSPASLPTLADTANLRVRQIDSAGLIHTIAGIGTTTGETLALTGPTTVGYGSGPSSLTATLAASPANGSVTFFDLSAATPSTLASVALAGNVASLPTASLAAGAHRLSATYAGDPTHTAAQSGVFALLVAPAPATATPAPVSLLYGQPIPALTGSLSGLFAQDFGKVTLVLASNAAAFSVPAAYPIAATLTGPAATNYTLTVTPAAITIAPAPTVIALSASPGGTAYAAHVASTTAGTPTGPVRLLDGAALLAASTLSPTGDATLTPSALSSGTHTLTVVYAGDGNFLPSTSAPDLVTIGSSTLPDFALTATGQTTMTALPGSSAAFSFGVSPLNGALSSPIQLAAAGLPPGATASFNPAYLPPGNTVSAFVLTVLTAKAALDQPYEPIAFGLGLPLLLFTRKRPLRRFLIVILGAAILTAATGCGDRINAAASVSTATQAYTITVTGTATSSSGAILTHSAQVTLIVQQ